jgi:hypothetical protein
MSIELFRISINRAITPRVHRSRAKLREATWPNALAWLSALVAFVATLLLYITRYLNFFSDEWYFIESRRPWHPDTLLSPHYGQWMSIPVLIWKALFAVVGLRNHLAYEAALLVAHASCVVLFFVLVRRRSGDLPAFATALTLLVVGSGAEEVIWAFQIGFVSAVAFGLLAMVLLERAPLSPRRVAMGSAALVGSLMSSSAGIAFVVATGVELGLDPQRRRALVALIAPVAAYAAWFLGAAINAVYPSRPPCSTCVATGLTGDANVFPLRLDYVVTLTNFVVTGIERSAAFIVGTSGLGAVVLPILVALLAFQWYQHRKIASWQIGMLAAIVIWFVLIGLGPAQSGMAYAGNAYVGSVFSLALFAEVAGDLPWHGLWRPTLITILALSLLLNGVQLFRAATNGMMAAATENAELQTVGAFTGAPDIALHAPIDNNTTADLSAASYVDAVRELGSPVPTVSPNQVARLPRQAVDRVMRKLFGGALGFTGDNARSTIGLHCQIVNSSGGLTLELGVLVGQPLMLRSSSGGNVFVFLGYLDPPTSEPMLRDFLQPSTSEWLHVPDTGQASMWRVAIRTDAIGKVEVCSASSAVASSDVDKMYFAEGAVGKLDPGWQVLSDTSTPSGLTALALHGYQSAPYTNDIFGMPTVPQSGAYDVWFRVKVKSSSGAAAEMTVGLWDDDKQMWLSSTPLEAAEVGTTYAWVEVAARVTPTPGHSVHFLVSFFRKLATDWYVDEAAMIPSDSPRLPNEGS